MDTGIKKSRLADLDQSKKTIIISRSYSRFIRAMRYILPLLALGLLAVVVTWSEIDHKIVAIPQEDLLSPSENILGQTELTNPKFDTVDEFNQPISVTADQALQNQSNPDIIHLKKPIANFKTEGGNAIYVESLNGTLEQKEEKLFLQDKIKITHDDGYVLEGNELRLNMKTKQAFSDKDVKITSDRAVINAQGLDGNMETGIIIFKGPATLILNGTPQDQP